MVNKIETNSIKEITLKSLEEAYHSNLTEPSLKSAKFVECFGKNLFEKVCEVRSDSSDLELAVQEVREDGSGKKSGEWLLDIVIKKEYEIQDPEIDYARAKLAEKLLWAVESEYHTSIKEMAIDFGKLVVTNADNYVYLNGVNQKTIENVEEYIERRIQTVKTEIMDEIPERFTGSNVYYGFWPSPGGSNWPDGQWETLELQDLKNRVRLFELE